MEMFWWRVKSKAVYNLSLNIHDQAGIASKMKKGGGEEYSKDRFYEKFITYS